MKKNLLILLIIILFSLPSVMPFFNKGFFQSDDGEWMIIRASAFYTALRDWQFPVRYLSSLNYGYGYPVANFLYPGFMYLTIPIHLLGFGFVESIKIILGLSMVGSAIFSFLWLSKLFNKFSAFVGAMFYLYTPYHLFDLYKRGSVGEILALSVMPFVLWQIERKSLFWASLGIALLVVSHNTLAILFTGIILAYMCLDLYISKDKTNLLRNYLLILMFGLGIASFFWIPAFLDLKYTVFSEIQVSEWNKYFSNLSQIGISTFLVFVLTVIFFMTGIIKPSKHRLTSLFLIIGILSLFFASPISGSLWNSLPVSFIQFPFRFLSVTLICIAFLSAVVINQTKGYRKIILAITFFVLLGFSTSPHIKPKVFFDKGDQYYATNEDTTTVKNEYMPVWVKSNPKEHYEDKVKIINGTISNLSIRPNSVGFDATSAEATKITINTIYFPGWKVFIDTNNSIIDYSNEKGVMSVNMPAGIHRVTTYFFETPVRLASDIVSAAFALVLLLVILDRERKKKV